MPNVKNQETLVKIKEDLDGVSAMWVVDYCGLTVKDIQALRTAIRESGASLKVYKNTLMHIALEESNLPTLDDMLAGPRRAAGPDRRRHFRCRPRPRCCPQRRSQRSRSGHEGRGRPEGSCLNAVLAA